MSTYSDPYASVPAERQAWGKTYNPLDGRGVDFQSNLKARTARIPRALLPKIENAPVDLVRIAEEQALSLIADATGAQFFEPAQ